MPHTSINTISMCGGSETFDPEPDSDQVLTAIFFSQRNQIHN